MRFLALRDVCELVTDGTHYTPPDVGAGVPFLTVKDISDEGVLDFEGCSKITRNEFERASMGNSAPLIGDVLFSKDGTVGKVSVVHQRNDFAVLSSIAILRPNIDVIDSEYLGHALRSPRILEQAQRKKTGSAIRRIILSDLKNIQLPVPNLKEQRRIAMMLDKANAMRSNRRKTITKLGQLIQSAFLSAMHGEVFNVFTVGELLERKVLLHHKDGNHGSNYPRKEEFCEVGVPFLSAQNLLDDGGVDLNDLQLLSESKANSLKIGWIEKGDVLLAHNASVGKVALYSGAFDRALIGTSLTAFRPDPEKLRPEFLFMFLRSDEFQKELTKDMAQTTRNQVPITAQRRLSIRVPSLDVQDKIVRVVGSIERQRYLLNAQYVRMETLIASLQQQAFAGSL